MNCTKFKILLKKLTEQSLSENESKELHYHISTCEDCKQEYKAIIKYKQLTESLKQNTPVLSNKEHFIDEILNQLPDKEILENKFNTRVIHFLPYKFRLVISSIAASMVLFFAVQQTYDAWQIKQLENKYAYKQKSIDYTLLKASILIHYLEHKDNYRFTGLLSKAGKILINQTFANIQYKYSIVSNYETKKTSDSGFIKTFNSTHHP
jgi:hypothetical protein